MKAWILSFACICQSLLLGAQVQTTCMVHTDKSFYVNGETMWYQVYLPDHLEGTKVTVKVVMLDGDNRLQGYYFLASEGKTVIPAYYKIPYDANSGMYRLLIWGRTLNSTRETIFAAVPFPVYNDLTTDPQQVTVQDASGLEASGVPRLWSNELEVKIEVSDKVRTGSMTSIDVGITDKNGIPLPNVNLSLSVTDHELTGDEVLPVANVQRAYPLPRTRWENNIFLRGKITTAQDTVDPTGLTIGGFLPPTQRLFYSRVDANSQFVLQFPGFYETSNIQFISYPERSFRVQLANALSTPPPPPLIYTEGVLRYLALSRQRKKIYQVFTTVEQPLNVPAVDVDFDFPDPDRLVDPGLYEPFPDLATLFKEVVTPLRFNFDRKSEKYVAKMYNPAEREFYTGAPLFIIDDQLSRDADFIARLNPVDIESISLFYEFDQLFNQFMFLAKNGVVIIKTKTGKTQLPREGGGAELQGLLRPATFRRAHADGELPDISPLVHWSSDVATDENGRATFTFPLTDDRSQFRIHVVGQTADGRRVQGEAFFHTMPNR